MNKDKLQQIFKDIIFLTQNDKIIWHNFQYASLQALYAGCFNGSTGIGVMYFERVIHASGNKLFWGIGMPLWKMPFQATAPVAYDEPRSALNDLWTAIEVQLARLRYSCGPGNPEGYLACLQRDLESLKESANI